MSRPVRTVSSSLAFWVVSSLTLGACNTLLGIEEAHVDPRLEARDREPDAASPQVIVPTSSAEPEPSSTGFDSGLAPTSSADGGFGFSDAGPAGSGVPTTQGDAAPPPVPTAPETPNGPEPDDGTAVGGEQDAGGAASEQDAAPPEATLCEKYCDEIGELCTGNLEQYRDRRQCLTICSFYPEGSLLSEDNDNSVACRLRYASKARYAAGVEHAAYCRQAGPGGDGRCGSNCEGYCTLMMGVCTEETADLYRFPNVEECISACEDLPTTTESYSTSNVAISDGDHVQCRLFHVTSAAMLDAEEHCEHAMGLTLCEAAEEPAP